MQIFIQTTALMHWLIMCRPTERERTECAIKAKLRNIMMFQDLENITSKEVRAESVFVIQRARNGLNFLLFSRFRKEYTN